jgi:hypothetical protein
VLPFLRDAVRRLLATANTRGWFPAFAGTTLLDYFVTALLAMTQLCYRTGIGGRGTDANSGSVSGGAVVCGGGSICRGA